MDSVETVVMAEQEKTSSVLRTGAEPYLDREGGYMDEKVGHEAELAAMR